MKIRKQKLFLLILLTTLFSRIDDASCYNYTIDGDLFYLYADGYIGGIQMTLSHDESFTINLKQTTVASYTVACEDCHEFFGRLLSIILVAEWHHQRQVIHRYQGDHGNQFGYILYNLSHDKL